MPYDWVSFYTKSNLIEIDPRLQAGIGRTTPLYWDRHLLKDIPGSQQFFDVAEKFGLCSGIGFSMPGNADFEYYMVSFNSSRARYDWIDESTAGRACLFASYFHQFYRSALVADRIKTPLRGHPLTAREQECLSYLAKGLTNPQIARAMSITDRTAAFHISHILAKLNAENRTEAVAVALKIGIVT
jgi:DNA-binding CsgD family transcriptional regulator